VRADCISGKGVTQLAYSIAEAGHSSTDDASSWASVSRSGR
jgi:hypothetical protein